MGWKWWSVSPESDVQESMWQVKALVIASRSINWIRLNCSGKKTPDCPSFDVEDVLGEALGESEPVGIDNKDT